MSWREEVLFGIAATIDFQCSLLRAQREILFFLLLLQLLNLRQRRIDRASLRQNRLLLVLMLSTIILQTLVLSLFTRSAVGRFTDGFVRRRMLFKTLLPAQRLSIILLLAHRYVRLGASRLRLVPVVDVADHVLDFLLRSDTVIFGTVGFQICIRVLVSLHHVFVSRLHDSISI